MSPKKLPCKNHPENLTARKCFYCKKPICPACQLHLAHHLFCGKSCYYKWKWQQLTKRIKFSPQFIFLLILLILSNILIIIYVSNKIDNVTQRPQIDESIEVKTTITDSLKVKIDSLRYPMDYIFQLRLKVNKGTIVALSRNGEFIESYVQKEMPVRFRKQYLHTGKNGFALWALQNNGKSTLLDSFTINFRSARIEYLRKYVTEVKSDGKSVALTFDGGSLDRGTKEILDALRAAGIHCTMFLTGSYIKRYPGLVKQMLDDGHEIANHSFTHPHLTHLEIDGSNRTLPDVHREFLYRQLLTADSLYQEISGQPMAPFWRAPFGEINNDILLWAAEAGYKHIGWSKRCDTWDWVADSTSSLYRSNQEILKNILTIEEERNLSGKIVLMHLGTERESDFHYIILPELINTLKNRGYCFKTISQLLAEN